MTNIICQIAWRANTERDALSEGPDTGAARARHDSALFLPGVSSSLLAFVVFGTTTPFRKHMREVLTLRDCCCCCCCCWGRLRRQRPESLGRKSTSASPPLAPAEPSPSSTTAEPRPRTPGHYEVTVYGPRGRRTTTSVHAGAGWPLGGEWMADAGGTTQQSPTKPPLVAVAVSMAAAYHAAAVDIGTNPGGAGHDRCGGGDEPAKPQRKAR